MGDQRRCWPRLGGKVWRGLRHRLSETSNDQLPGSCDTSTRESPSGASRALRQGGHALLAHEGGAAGDNKTRASSRRDASVVLLPGAVVRPAERHLQRSVTKFEQLPAVDQRERTSTEHVQHSSNKQLSASFGPLTCVHRVIEMFIEPTTSERAHMSPPTALMQPVSIQATKVAAYSPTMPPLSCGMYDVDRRVPLPTECAVELREPQVKEDVSIRAESPTCVNFMAQATRSRGIHTFVMMPLDFGQDHGWLSNDDALNGVLSALRHTGVRGVMVDVWWGLCERQPHVYDFDKYLWLADACRRHNLRLQAVMAFHACGGNVGDNVNVPLPHWASEAADAHGAWYLERAQKDGADPRTINREYISLGADHCVFLPGSEGLRTPIETYKDFIEAFCRTMTDRGFAGSTVTEVQVGMGPCGEVRYPSYPLRDGKWRFPGIGEPQCFDKYLQASLAAAAKRESLPVEWGTPPSDTGHYNGRVQDAPFYNGEHRSPRGRFFLRWYSEALVQHCDDILTAVTAAARRANMEVAVKVAGIHWGYLTAARAPECNAGYLVNEEYCFYDEVAAVLRRHGAVLDFTCLEMASEHQPEEANAAPKQLVHDVFGAAARAGVPVAGENALECYDRDSFNRVVQAFRWSRADAHGFTLLRLTKTLLEEGHLHNLRRLAEKLRHVN